MMGCLLPLAGLAAPLTESEAMPPHHLAQTIAMASAKGARLNCAALQRIETVYAKRKLAAET